MLLISQRLILGGSEMNNVLLHLKNFYYAERKPLYIVMKELIQYTIYEKEFPMYYFMNLLYRPNVKNLKSFAGGKKLKKVNKYYQTNNVFLDNKLLFYLFMNTLNYRTPKVFAYSNNGRLYRPYSEEVIKENTLMESIEKLMYLNQVNEIFIKPIDKSGGQDCFLYTERNKRNARQEIINMLSSGFLFQEVIKQNEEISKIYPHSINTIRIYTLKDNNANIKVISALMRFGVNGKSVDNASSGGLFVPVDIDNGILGEEGLQLLKHGGNTYRTHPDTGYEFKGFQIPQFDEIIEKSIKLSEKFSNKIVGWDLAVSNDEIVFIEGNSKASLLMGQIACGGFNAHPIYSKLLNTI